MAASKTVSTVVLTQKADMKQVRLTITESGATMSDIAKYFKKKEAPELIGSYPTKLLTLFLFAYTKGRVGQENKHELPPPLDERVLFGDILILASKHKMSFAEPINFKTEDYETFYKKMFGDFEDLDEDEEEEEEEEVVDEEVEVVADEEDCEENLEVDEEPEEEVVRVVRKRKTDTSVTIPILKFNLEDKLISENCDSPTTTNPQRLAIIAKVKAIIPGVFNDDEMVRIERSIFNSAILRADRKHIPTYWKHNMFQEMYIARARHILANLSTESYVGNDELVKMIKTGEITIESLETMDNYQIFPSKWKADFEFQQLREKRQLEGNKSMATDKFTCGRCWKKECTYYEMQTRSADEPMTIFITCLNCGKHWRQ
jgi:DNA-directed RNA polymerase subunit M/transcription elongation factor TFIIS